MKKKDNMSWAQQQKKIPMKVDETWKCFLSMKKQKKTKDRVKTLVLADSRFDTDFHFQSNLYYNAMIASKCSFFFNYKAETYKFSSAFYTLHNRVEKNANMYVRVCVWSALMKLKNRSHHKISVLKKSTSPFIYQNELREITSI